MSRSSAASPFGRGLLGQFPLEPGGIYLNHGTVGVTPLVVMRERAAILDEIERHPSRYMIRELMTLGGRYERLYRLQSGGNSLSETSRLTA